MASPNRDNEALESEAESQQAVESFESLSSNNTSELEDPVQVGNILCEHDKVEALIRSLGGSIALPRELLWKVVDDMGLWKTVAMNLGSLSTIADIELPLLDPQALAAALNMKASSLAAKQLRRGLFELLSLKEVESVYEQWHLGEIERVANNVLDSPEEAKSRLSSSQFLQPLSSWSFEEVGNFIRLCGADPLPFVTMKVDGRELDLLEMQGQYGLEEGLFSLKIIDPIVRQRVQFQVSLLKVRQQVIDKVLSGEGLAGILGNIPIKSNENEHEIQDAAWWANSSFGVRAKKALDQWSIEDVLRFAKTLRLSSKAMERLKAFAIDGKSLMDLSDLDMEREIKLDHVEQQALRASILLLSRPPEVFLGTSKFVHMRILNKNSSVYQREKGLYKGTFVLSADRVHTFVLYPENGLIEAVNQVRSKRQEWSRSVPAVRIWYKVYEYGKDANDSKAGWKPCNSTLESTNTARYQQYNLSTENLLHSESFSDAGEVSVSSILRKRINTIGPYHVTRWDPLHPFVTTQSSIVNGWRFLTTSNIEKGPNNECARLNVSFDTSILFENTKDASTQKHFRLCFAFQVVTINSFDEPMKVVPVGLGDDGVEERGAKHLFTLSPAFLVSQRDPQAVNNPIKRKKKLKKSKNLNVAKRGSNSRVFRERKNEVLEKHSKLHSPKEPKPPPRIGGKRIPKKLKAEELLERSDSPQHWPRKLVYAEEFQRERLERLESTQKEFEHELTRMKQNQIESPSTKKTEKTSNIRVEAAVQLGTLLGMRAHEGGCLEEENKTDSLREEIQSKLNEIHSMFVVRRTSPYMPDPDISGLAKLVHSPPANSNWSEVQFSPRRSPMSTSSLSSSSSSSTSSSSISPTSRTELKHFTGHDDWAKNMLAVGSDEEEEEGQDQENDFDQNSFRTKTKGSREDSPGDNTAEDIVGVQDDMASLWADRIKTRFLDKEVVRYPLRPAPAFQSEREFKGLQLAVFRLGAETTLQMLNAYDPFRTGWVSEDSFLKFVEDINHGKHKNEIMENLNQLEAKQLELKYSGPALVYRNGETLFIRYERLALLWTKDERTYGRALAKRIWELAERKSIELLFFIERSQRVKLCDLQQVDPDIMQQDLDVLLNFRDPSEYLQSTLLRANQEKMWLAITSILRERQGECLDLLSRMVHSQSMSLADDVSIEYFAKLMQRILNLTLSDEELTYISNVTNAYSPQVVNIQNIFNASQNVGIFDTNVLFEHLASLDSYGSGYVCPTDMYQALRSSLKGKGTGRDLLEKAQDLSLDFEKRKMQYSKWIELTFSCVSHDQVVTADLRRLGSWFSSMQLPGQKTFLNSLRHDSGDSPKMERKKLEQILDKFGFSTPYLYDICVLVGAENGGEIDYEVLLKSSLAGNSSQDQKIFGQFILNRLVLEAGGVINVLKELYLVDIDAIGTVRFEELLKALRCREEDVQVAFPDRPQIVQYETLLFDLVQELSKPEPFVKGFTHHKIRRAMKRCQDSQSCTLYDLLISDDDLKHGFISVHQLSWELRMFQVFLESEGPEATYLLSKFGEIVNDEVLIDYEYLIFSVSMEESITFDERSRVMKEFVVKFFCRELKKAQVYLGMFHVFDSSWDLIQDQGQSGLCSRRAFILVLENVFKYCCKKKISSAIAVAIDLYALSGGPDTVQYEKFASDVTANLNDESEGRSDRQRHDLMLFIRSMKTSGMILYDLFREFDGDQDGTISLRNFSRALSRIGLQPPSEEALKFLDIFDGEGAIQYEQFVERAEALYHGLPPSLTANRLRSILKRINSRVMKLRGLSSPQAVFLSFLEDSERGKVLNQWDLFYMLREHGSSIATVEELSSALKRMLGISPLEDEISISSVQWLHLTS